MKYDCQKKWHQCEIRIVINDKSQGSIAKHLRNGELFTTHLLPNLLVKDLKRIGEHLAKLQAKNGWLGSRVVSVLDSGAEGPGSNRSRDAVG